MQTSGVVPNESHQSPSRQQKPTDPRRESTVLFKGFSASTAETGLLEVDEIAEINGSPELLRVAHNSAVTKPKTPDPPAPPHSSTAPSSEQAANAAHQVENSDSQAVSTDAVSSSVADAEIADHQRLNSSSQSTLALAPDLEHSFELQTQQGGPGQPQGTAAGAGPSVRAGLAVKLQSMQVHMCVCVCVDMFPMLHQNMWRTGACNLCHLLS